MRTLFFALPFLLLNATAVAQLETGRRLLDEADFRRAIRAFDRAERSEDLTYEDLVLLYEGRAMARLANGDEDDAERDIDRLATIDPRHVFPAEAPPELADMLERSVREHGGGMTLELDVAEQPGGSVISVTVIRDAHELTREVRLHVRIDGGPWRDAADGRAEIEHAERARIEAYAEAVGPGGAIIAFRGTEREPELLSEAPAVVSAPTVPLGATEPDPVVTSGGGDDTGLIVGLVVGGIVLVGLAVGLGVGLGVPMQSDRTQPSAPMVEF